MHGIPHHTKELEHNHSIPNSPTDTVLWPSRDPLRAFGVAQAGRNLGRGGDADGEGKDSGGEVDDDEDGGEPEGEFRRVVAEEHV